jgi:hypothetical protein
LVIVICLIFVICDLEFLFLKYFSTPKQLPIFTSHQLSPVVADFGNADALVLSVPEPCSASVLEIPVSVLGACSASALGVPVSVPGSCSDGVLAIPFSVLESCSASALGVAVCVLVAGFDTCSECVEVASALLAGDF